MNKRFFDKINLIRICIKTNDNIVKITFDEELNIFQSLGFKAHIIDSSNEFHVYELPINNMRNDHEYSKKTRGFQGDKVIIKGLSLEVESKEEKNYEIELKYIDFCYEDGFDNSYKNYKLPIFVRI